MQSQQLLNYLEWLKDRAMVWPALLKSAALVTSAYEEHSRCQDEPTANYICEHCQMNTDEFLKAITPNNKLSCLFVSDIPLEEDEEKNLMDKIIAAMNIDRHLIDVIALEHCFNENDLFLVNINYNIAGYYINTYIEVRRPSIVILLGKKTSEIILQKSFESAYVHVHHLKNTLNTKCLVTFHPRDLLRFPKNKGACWEHIKIALRIIADEQMH